MAGLSAVSKARIIDALDSTKFTQRGFTVKHEDGGDPVATIAFSSSPEFQFVIDSSQDGAFTTSECPGIRLAATETFHRSDFDACISAIPAWVERIVDRQRDSILDEFGGVADMNPALK